MPIPLGVLAVAGAGAAGAAGAYELLETQILTDDLATSVTFSNLNSTYGSTYQHLQVRLTVKTTNSGSYLSLLMRFNADDGNNYADHTLYGNGSSVLSSAATSQPQMVVANSARSGDSGYGSSIIDILDPFETSKNKTIRSLFGVVNDPYFVQLRSGLWMNTAAVTSIGLRIASNNLKAGSRFSLYGLRSA